MKVPVVQIEQGVPIPDEPDTRFDFFPLESLAVGESFEFPAESRAYVQSRASTIKRRKGMGYTVRKVEGGACRVWRTT